MIDDRSNKFVSIRLAVPVRLDINNYISFRIFRLANDSARRYTTVVITRSPHHTQSNVTRNTHTSLNVAANK